MFKAGIILVIIQVLVTIVSLSVGNNPFSGGIFKIIGYFLCGIIGIILIIIAKSKKNNDNDEK